MVGKVQRSTFESVRILSLYESISSGEGVTIQEQYEKLANLVAEYGGRIHSSQYTMAVNDESIAVYFQIPKDSKQAFEKEYGE